MSRQSRPLKIAYFGSPLFSAHLLDGLIKYQGQHSALYEVCCVITQPDRPAGRGLSPKATPVKTIAQSQFLPVHDKPLGVSVVEVEKLLSDVHIDLALVYAFNEFVPPALMRKVPHGFWNIHPSLLPRYRGPSPVVFPLILGDTETGVTLMQMTEKMDAGPVLTQEKVPICAQDTHSSLINLLTSRGLSLFLDSIRKLHGSGENPPSTTQTESYASYTFKLGRNDGYIPLEILREVMSGRELDYSCLDIFNRYYTKNPSAPRIKITMQVLYNLWRALDPWPGVWTWIQTPSGEKRLKIKTMVAKDADCTIEKVQIEGKNPVDWATFARGYPSVLA